MATTNTKTAAAAPRHHYIRTIFASLFGFVAVALILVSILVLWLDRTLTNTDQYVKTVAPLVTKPAVQNFVVDKVSDQLLNNNDAPISDLANQLLTPDQVAGKTTDQLKAEVTPIVKDSLRSVVSSASFATLWQNTNRNIHSQLITQLNDGAQVINLDFHPVISGVVDQLSTTKLGFVKDKLKLGDNVGQVSLKGKQLDTVRKVYNYFQKAMLALLACAILALILCILISVHHLKTMRRITLLTGIFSGLLAILLSAASLIQLGGSDPEQAAFMKALVNGVTAPLRLTLIVIAVLCLAVSIGSKIYAVVTTRQKPTTTK